MDCELNGIQPEKFEKCEQLILFFPSIIFDGAQSIWIHCKDI